MVRTTIYGFGFGFDRYISHLNVKGSGPPNKLAGKPATLPAGKKDRWVKPPRGFDISPYSHVEREAREAKRGMRSFGDKYVSPKEFRKMHRKKGGN